MCCSVPFTVSGLTMGDQQSVLGNAEYGLGASVAQFPSELGIRHVTDEIQTGSTLPQIALCRQIGMAG